MEEEEEEEEKIPQIIEFSPKGLEMGKEITGGNSRKSVRWSAVLVPCLSKLWFKLRGEQQRSQRGSMT